MADHPDSAAVKAELDRLTNGFFRAVSFEEGTTPLYESIYELFIEAGLLIKNTSSTPEISTVSQFIEPRLAAVRSGDLTRFNEVELCETTQIFGNVAHRFNSYAKSGTIKGVPFTAVAWSPPNSFKPLQVGRLARWRGTTNVLAFQFPSTMNKDGLRPRER